MKRFALLSASVLALTTAVLARDVPQSGPAANGSPAWFIYQAPPAPPPPPGAVAGRGRGGGRGDRLAACADDAAKLCGGKAGPSRQACLEDNEAAVSQQC